MRLQRQPAVEVAALPAVAARSPVDGVLRLFRFAPLPAGVAPELPLRIAAGVDEGGELRLRDRCAGDAERLHLDRMRPFLIVEDEGLVRRRAEHEGAAGNVDVAGQRTRGFAWRTVALGPGIAEGLPRVGESFAVHVFVKDGQFHEVLVLRCQAVLDAVENGFLDLTHVGEHPVSCQQRQVPAGVGRNGDRVVEGIGVAANRGLAVPSADPLLLEPGDVADLPEERIDDGQARPHQLIVGQVGDQVDGAAAGVAHPDPEINGVGSHIVSLAT